MEPFKTTIPAEIKTVTEAKNFLKALHDNGEEYHPEDNAHTIVWKNSRPTTEQADQLNKVMADIESLTNFDPCEYLLFLSGRVLVKAKFQIGDSHIFEGYHRPGENWNGFSLPYFEKETAEAILLFPEFYEGCVYDPSADQFIIHEEGQITTIEGITVDTEHGPMKLYPVGAGYWVWELAEEVK